MLRVKVRKILSRATGSDGPREAPPTIEGTLAVFVRRVWTPAGERAAIAQPEQGLLAQHQAEQAVQIHRPLCVRLADGHVWWSSSVLAIEHNTRGLPCEVTTRTGSLYQIEYLDRGTLPGVGP